MFYNWVGENHSGLPYSKPTTA